MEKVKDTIYRQDAIDAMWKIRRQLQMLDDTHNADRVMHGIYLAKKALEQLPSAQPEQQWIPCSERLPEGITQVIIQTNGEAIHEAIYMGKDDYGHYVWKRPDNEIYWDEEVVAWMPLPTPYQPKEDICK